MLCCTDLLQSSTVELDYSSVVLEHTYAEGIDFTVTDLVLYPCVNYLLVSINHFSTVVRMVTVMGVVVDEGGHVVCLPSVT